MKYNMKYRCVSFKAVFLSTILFFGSLIAGEYSGGLGTTSDPYLIGSEIDLVNLSTNFNDYSKSFQVISNILLSAEYEMAVIAPHTGESTPIGDGSSYQGHPFCGVFDGAGHTIENLKITSTNANSFLGLFGRLDGTISRLVLENVDIDGGVESQIVGGLVGCTYGHDALIEQCSSSGSISGGKYVGGLVGLASDEAKVVRSKSQSKVFGDFAGGLCGRNYGGYISDSYASGLVSGSKYIAGFCAQNSGVLSNSFSYAVVRGGLDLAGFCANGSSLECDSCGFDPIIIFGETVNCFWDIDRSGQFSSDGGVGTNSFTMKNSTIFEASGWDFQNVWYMNEYPALQGFYRDFSAGSGSNDDPYVISTAKEFLNLAGNPLYYDRHFLLSDDIDLAGYEFEGAVIAGFDPWEDEFTELKFSGSFDGGGHVIRNVIIKSDALNKNYNSFFGSIDDCGVVVRLGLEGVYIDLAESHSVCVGGFAALNNGYINECYVKDVRIRGGLYTGGLSGYNSGSILNCFVDNTSDGLEFCLESQRFLGGLVGFNEGIVSNCYAATKMSSASYIGGLCGGASQKHSSINSFWDINVSGVNQSDGGEGIATSLMEQEQTFGSAGWDYTNVWYMAAYPDLKCFERDIETLFYIEVCGGSGTGYFAGGASVEIIADAPDSGFMFSHWTVNPAHLQGNISYYCKLDTTFLVGSNNVTLTANYLKRPHLTPRYEGAQPNEWTMDIDAALEYARTNDLHTIFMFTGAWWCPDCFYFDTVVLENPEWLEYLEENPVMLVMLDYPLRPSYGFPVDHPMNRCFLWDEQYRTENRVNPADADARLAQFRAIEEEYTLPSVFAKKGYFALNYPSFVVHRPDGSRAGRMSLEQDDNPSVSNVISKIQQAMASDPFDELDDEALMAPPVIDFSRHTYGVPLLLNYSLSEVDLADNYLFIANSNEFYRCTFNINEGTEQSLLASIISSNGTDILQSTTITATSTVYDISGLSGTNYLKISSLNSLTNMHEYSLYFGKDAYTTTPTPVPYSWLNQYINLVESGNYEQAALDDKDGDGMKTWEEYVAGTVPINGNSRFISTIDTADANVVIGWEPDLSPNRIYQVEGKETLTDGWASTNGASHFFRVEVIMP